MSTDEQAQMVDDISSIIMRGRYGRVGVGRPSDNPIDLRDARRIVEYVMARDARVRRDAAREALDGAEHRIARLEAQTSIRGRAVVYACERTREAEAERDRNLRNSREAKKRAIRAEARIKAVEDVLELHGPAHDEPGQDEADCGPMIVADIRRALDPRATDGEDR